MRKKYSAKQVDKINNARKQVENITDKSDYIKLYRGTVEHGLNPNQIVVLNYIYDTMRISWTKGNKYYDKKRHAYYAVVSRKTLSDKFNISESTAGETLSELCEIGYISKVQTWNSGIKVFVRHFNFQSQEKAEKDDSKSKNLPSSKKHLNKNQPTVDTQHTSASNLNIDDKINVGIQKELKSIFGNKDKSGSSENKMDDKKDDEHINYAVNGTKSLPEGAVNRIDKMATNLYGSDKRAKGEFIYGINGLIYRTKSQVAKKSNLHSYFRWENTPELAQSFSANIYEMLYGAYSGTRSFKCPKDAYFVGSLKKFFNAFVRKALHKPSKGEKKPQRKHIHEKIPEWAQAGYKPDESGISAERKKELAAKLGNIKA